MSRLIYDGADHTIELVGADGKSVGKWTAYNNIDSTFATAHYGGARHLTNGSYTTVDRTRPFAHVANPNGPYGSYGIIRFIYPGHSGVGVHSGRADAKHAPGAQHATHGCIRTTDDAMAAIKAAMATDGVTLVVVQGNSEAAAKHGVGKHKHLNIGAKVHQHHLHHPKHLTA